MDFQITKNSKTKDDADLPYDLASDSLSSQVCFVLKDGEELSFNNSYYLFSSYSPEKSSIEINFSFARITISGRMLEDLFTAIRLQKVDKFRLSDSTLGDINENGVTWIDSIGVQMLE